LAAEDRAGGHRPSWLVRADDVPEVEGRYPPPWDAEITSHGRDLGRAAGSRRIGAWRERLAPGHRTAFTHAHLREEELVFVLSGHPSVRWIDPGQPAREEVLDPGDFAAFPAGTGIAHAFVNRSHDDAVLLVIGERDPADRVAYPEDPAFEEWRRAARSHRTWTDLAGPAGDAQGAAHHIETDRLVLRPFRVDEAPALVAAHHKNRAHLSAFMDWARVEATVDDMAKRIQEWRGKLDRDEDFAYGVFEPDGTLIGATGMHDRIGRGATEIGYWVDREREGRGYVTEWVGALCRIAFEVRRLDRIEIRCDPANERSAAVPARLGFRHETTLVRRVIATDGTASDSMIWTMFASEFPTSAAARTPVRAWDAVRRRLL
jgi:uncharacterized cupin superfamily protein/RimJ/RimL family protein N-acetyltransferase